MKQVRAFLIIFLYAFMSLSANAANYCNLLWSNNTLPSASLNITFDGNTSQVFPLGKVRISRSFLPKLTR